ncbi:hypothetical protein SAY87_023582 [Trapa incisa]|uniref:Methyltransferase PMT24 n=1 Tax=Trapa incisa TaxID=236973 RepID=A0AAN7QSA1_9MYRT|nr:hypothetical protein SAY87_023582 [Trapa incisa]
MASLRYSRVDGRRQSNYCSTVAVVMVLAFGLFAVWIFMSSSIVPADVQDPLYQDNHDSNNTDVKHQVMVNSPGQQFEDSSGDLPENIEKTVEKQLEGMPKGEKKGSEGNSVEKIGSESSAEETVTNSQSGNNPIDRIGDEKMDIGNNGDDNEVKNEELEQTTGENSVIKEEDESNSPTPNIEKVKRNSDQKSEQAISGTMEHEKKIQDADDFLPKADQSEILKETTTQNGAWSTQAVESQNEKKSQENSVSADGVAYPWKICNTTAGPDYIPCLDNWQVVRRLPDMSHFQHRERHCPGEGPTCLVPHPKGYRKPVPWPKSRDKIWFYNVPHTKLADVKGHQNWVKVTGEYLTFPGGGTQFIHGASGYINLIEQGLPAIAWGKRSRVILDVGCGVASFGGYLYDKDVLAMSFAPKDEHEAQVQFALERGIPAILSVMGSHRLPFPGGVFDIVHCARCRVPWHVEGGRLLLELNRVLRPGGYFIWSATPVYRKNAEDSGIWKEMSKLTKAMCWDLLVIVKDKTNSVATAIYRKPTSNECYQERPKEDPPFCKESDDQNAAWNVPLESCLHKIPVDASERGSHWPEQWPKRLEKPPYWLKSKTGVYGKAAPEDFTADYEHWKNVVSQSYLKGIGISWSTVRNVMDMRAVYGGFAAALVDLKLWVMNVVPVDSPDTLPIIYERGLFGLYHDWCESFNTYPRSYDLLHADHLFSVLRKRCKLMVVMAEVDRILRPEGKLIVRDDVGTIAEIESMAKSLQWEMKLIYSQDKEGLLCVQKSMWRPEAVETIPSAII